MNEFIPLGQARVANLLVCETGTYNPQYRRPYQTHMEADTLNAVVERVAGAPKYNPMLLAGVASQFVLPQAAPEVQIGVDNGWDTVRGAFMMEVHYTHRPAGTVTVLFVQGYTDHWGVYVPTPSNVMLDDRMVFYINNITKVRSYQERTPMGLVDRMGVVENAQVLVNPHFEGVRQQQRDLRMRPEDVYSAMSAAVVNLNPDTSADMRLTMTDAPIKSRRKNALPAAYMASVLQGMSDAVQMENIGAGYGDLYTSARGAVAEESAAKDSFMKALAEQRGGHYSNHFTWAELKRLDSNVDNVTVVNKLGELNRHEVHTAGSTEFWHGSDRETLAAAILAQTVPALMMELTLTVIGFRATNHTIGGVLDAKPYHAWGFIRDIDVSPYVATFMNQMQMIILRDILTSSESSFQCDVLADMRGETWITVQFDNNPPVRFAVPSFCDSLLAPVLTQDRHRVGVIASDFDKLIGVITDANRSLGGKAGLGSSTEIFGNI